MNWNYVLDWVMPYGSSTNDPRGNEWYTYELELSIGLGQIHT